MTSASFQPSPEPSASLARGGAPTAGPARRTVVAAAGAVGVRLGISPVSKVVSILTAMVATSMGVFESIFGGKYAIWNPVDR